MTSDPTPMLDTAKTASANHPPETAEEAKLPPGRRLVDGVTAAGKIGCSYRHWLRLCDGGLAPYGIKLGHLRRWDLVELDAWIANACKPVRRGAGR